MSIVKNNVLKGKNGWLFLFQGQQSQFDYLTGVKIVDKVSISNFLENIKNRAIFCNEKKIIYQHVVFPSKPLLKRKFLPIKYKFSVTSLFDKYYRDSLSTSEKDVVYYPLEELEECEKKHSTFRKYDTHMSHKAYFEIATYLLNLIHIDIKKHPYVVSRRVLGGDLCNMLQSLD